MAFLLNSVLFREQSLIYAAPRFSKSALFSKMLSHFSPQHRWNHPHQSHPHHSALKSSFPFCFLEFHIVITLLQQQYSPIISAAEQKQEDYARVARRGGRRRMDERICALCHEGESEGQALLQACGCRGSIGWRHLKCIEDWVSYNNDCKACSICKVQYLPPSALHMLHHVKLY